MDVEIFSKIEGYMLSCMEDSAHDKEHIYRVLYNALEIATSEQQVDYDVLITGFLEAPGIKNCVACTINEKESLYTVFDLLLERAAKMLASGLVAIMRQGDMGKSTVRPAFIVVEGSTLLKSPVYQRKLECCSVLTAEVSYTSAGQQASVKIRNITFVLGIAKENIYVPLLIPSVP